MRPSGRVELATEAMGNLLPVQPHISPSANSMGEKRREPEGPANPSSSDDQRSSKGGPDLECVLCGERSSDKTNLERHLLTHTDFGYFDCSRCSASFVEKNQYAEHMSTQHPSASATPASSGDGQESSGLKQEPATTTSRHDVIVIGDDSDNEDGKCLSSVASCMDQGTFECDGESQLKIVNTMTLNPDVRSAPIVIDDDDDSSTSTVEWKGNIGDEQNLDKSLDDPQEEPQDKVPDGDANHDAAADTAAKEDNGIVTDAVVQQQEGDSADAEGRSGISDEKSIDSDTPKPDSKLESGDLNLDVDLSEAFSDSDCLQIADYFMVVSETSRDGEEDDEEGNAVAEVEKVPEATEDPSETDAELNRVEASTTADDALAEASPESDKQPSRKRTRSESPSQPNPESKRTETS